jgi:hypothetical protein
MYDEATFCSTWKNAAGRGCRGSSMPRQEPAIATLGSPSAKPGGSSATD